MFLAPPLFLKNSCNIETGDEQFSLQLFHVLATNIYQKTVSLELLDEILSTETVFCVSRALRRLLLGQQLYPFTCLNNRWTGHRGQNYQGIGLIIENNTYRVSNVNTHMYLPIIYSYEVTDTQFNHTGLRQVRLLYIPNLSSHLINYKFMFKIICRYLCSQDIDDCFAGFMSILDPNLAKICKINYEKLFNVNFNKVLLFPTCNKISNHNLLKFSLLTFLNQFLNKEYSKNLYSKILENSERHQSTFIWLCQQSHWTDITVDDTELVKILTSLNLYISYEVILTKKNPQGKPLTVFINSCNTWAIFPVQCPIYRIAACLLNPLAIIKTNNKLSEINSIHRNIGVSDILVSTFKKIDLVPKDRKINMTLNTQKLLAGQISNTTSILDSYTQDKHLSVNNFKITIFNTNMVINTKIQCFKVKKRYQLISNVPRITNNFVIKKFSFKEPSHTISLFYSDNIYSGAAINVNINGGVLNFLFAMGNLCCLLPVKNILPVSIANWNSTLDLHGLETQNSVRNNRKDVFWTTNFPSVVSSKHGFNVSWFKAATANISKVHGGLLVSHIQSEVLPIITNPQAKINFIKNSIFTTLETRNKSQIQTLHKRFIECLIECCSFMRLNVKTIKHLVLEGYLDFSKHIVCHTKSKHECALLGYKKCNLIPKILHNNKRSRLDELGRNSNFLSFTQNTGVHLKYKKNIIKHSKRKLGLKYKLHHN